MGLLRLLAWRGHEAEDLLLLSIPHTTATAHHPPTTPSNKGPPPHIANHQRKAVLGWVLVQWANVWTQLTDYPYELGMAGREA